MELWLLTLILGELAFVTVILWIVIHYRHRRADRQAEDRARLLERFGSGQELRDFLESDAGQQFLKLAALQGSPSWGTGGWLQVVKAVGAGVILLFVGGAFLLLASMQIPDGEGIMMIPALLLMMGGMGVLVAAAISGILVRRGRSASAPEGRPAGRPAGKLPGEDDADSGGH